MHHPNGNRTGSVVRGGEGKTSRDEEELDKLLLGLDKLTETLPDLTVTSAVKSLPSNAVSSSSKLQSRDNYDGGLSTLNNSTANMEATLYQPYHTRADSKPFSYFRTNNSSSSRATSRASSRENQLQSGLESPQILRKIIQNGGSNSVADSMSIGTDSRPLSPSVISRGSSPGLSMATSNPRERQDQLYSRINKSSSASSGLKEVSNNNMVDLEEASLTWLQKQQRKLEERRAAQRRREGHLTTNESSLMRELKTSLDRARSETTTDGYAASETASLLFSETSSTRESSPHKSRIVPIQLENNGYHSQQPQRTSTPKSRPNQQQQQPPEQNLSRHVSDTSYDRSRPLIQRRLRYDSEGEQSLNGHVIHSAASNTSIDSINSRPITPGFPTVPPTPIFGQPATNISTSTGSNSLKRLQQGNSGGLRAPSPSAGSMYHQQTQSRASSRRGSFSSEPADVSPAHVQLAKDNYKFWYKPHISRDEAINLLRPRPPGTFVVRDSNSFPGAFGLALKVATPPINAPPNGDGDELIRHFLIEPTSKGVKLKGYSNEPVFASLSALVYQHTVTPLALPSRLLLPEADLSNSVSPSRDSIDSKTSSMQQLLALGAACNVLYLFSMETDSLTGPNAVKKAVSQLMLTRPKPHATLVHFKVSSQGITLTDHGRKLFFRKHYNTSAISFCGIDPDDRRWSIKEKNSQEETSQRIFGFVARKSTSRATNQCHLFAEQDPDQPSRAIVNFVNKVLLNAGSNSGRADVV